MDQETSGLAGTSGDRPLPFIRRSAVAALLASRSSVIWITAPAGSGKTTLATQLCDQSGHAFVWLRAEARMADMGAFLAGLLAAFRKLRPAAGLPALASEDIAFPVDYLRRLIAAGSAGKALILVVDRFMS